MLGIDTDPPTLNIATTTDFTAGDVSAKILEGLIFLNPNYEPQPSLATAWTISPDGKTYRFTLRRGVKWHDGRDFTSADVKFSFVEVLAKMHPRGAPVFKNLGIEVDTPDSHTVVFRLQKAYAPFLSQMTVFDAPIIPRHLYEGTNIGTNPVNQRPVGTGPFKFAEWKRGATIRLVRNETYWAGADKPFLEQIVFQIIPQGPNRVPALQTGEIDELLDFYTPKPEVPRLVADKNLYARRGVNIPAIWFMMYNTKAGVFTNKDARHALAFAIDRQRIVKQVMQGIARPGAGAFGDGFKWMLNEDVGYAKKYPYDPARARTLLAKAGIKPNTTTVRIPFDVGRPQMRAQSQIIQDNLRQIGLEAQAGAAGAFGAVRAGVRQTRLRPDAAILLLRRRPGHRVHPALQHLHRHVAEHQCLGLFQPQGRRDAGTGRDRTRPRRPREDLQGTAGHPERGPAHAGVVRRGNRGHRQQEAERGVPGTGTRPVHGGAARGVRRVCGPTWPAVDRARDSLARVAAGGARWWLTATRSGAERADGPAVLAAGAHRQTRAFASVSHCRQLREKQGADR